MKHVIIYAHPMEESYNHAILDTAINALEVNKNNEITLIDLNKDGFNPIMSAEDLKAYNEGKVVSTEVIEYQKVIDEADHIIVIFPIWFTAMPAILKGFFEKVFTKGFAYVQDGKFPKPNFKGKTATVVTTMDGPNFYYDFIVGNPLKGELIHGILKFSGIKLNKWFKFGSVHGVSEGKRKNWLEKIEKYFSELGVK